MIQRGKYYGLKSLLFSIIPFVLPLAVLLFDIDEPTSLLNLLTLISVITFLVLPIISIVYFWKQSKIKITFSSIGGVIIAFIDLLLFFTVGVLFILLYLNIIQI